MGKSKEKLNLSVEESFRKLAEKLAEDSNRSISNLFEVLVAEEWERRKEEHKTPPGDGKTGRLSRIGLNLL